ncbi:PREDICTED: uncharacterized protein LOC107338657 [Acropora digitifera]|uniref:uncharacterized protein LOC107338657 n=1 Tax=Acropora digitifera TaxID=70779 RepID=UPI00077A22A6|nr:PREDICTED: uncharacterized protein LOC107338657 [Acropora digitifera]
MKDAEPFKDKLPDVTETSTTTETITEILGKFSVTKYNSCCSCSKKVEELKKLEKDSTALRQEVLYMEVYQRSENLCFYGIEEDLEGAEDMRQVLIDFLQSELGIDDASNIEFQRVHRIDPFNQQASKPRQIIARFLRYPDRERVMSNARILKGKHFGISADLPKEIVDRRKKLLPKFFAVKKAGKGA